MKLSIISVFLLFNIRVLAVPNRDRGGDLKEVVQNDQGLERDHVVPGAPPDQRPDDATINANLLNNLRNGLQQEQNRQTTTLEEGAERQARIRELQRAITMMEASLADRNVEAPHQRRSSV